MQLQIEDVPRVYSLSELTLQNFKKQCRVKDGAVMLMMPVLAQQSFDLVKRTPDSMLQ